MAQRPNSSKSVICGSSNDMTIEILNNPFASNCFHLLIFKKTPILTTKLKKGRHAISDRFNISLKLLMTVVFLFFKKNAS